MNVSAVESPYQVLGVSREASEAEIKRAYFNQVREHPPERDPEGFKRIRAAYEKLRSGTERAETDLFTIDVQPAGLDPAALLRSEVEPPPITLATLRADLLALEAALLLEELRTPASPT
jgi:curved DNA-binding protein CbpA